MAKRLAVLDWNDIQVLLQLSTRTVPQKAPGRDKQERARRMLIDDFLGYLKQWLPGQWIDDESRVRLVAGLEAYYRALELPEDSEPLGEPDHIEMRAQCFRIRKKLLETMGLPVGPIAADVDSGFGHGATMGLAMISHAPLLIRMCETLG